MIENDLAQWAADTERLLIASLSNGEGLLDSDELTVDAVRERCKRRFGEQLGKNYYLTLLATLPDRRPELFPEFEGFK